MMKTYPRNLVQLNMHMSIRTCTFQERSAPDGFQLIRINKRLGDEIQKDTKTHFQPEIHDPPRGLLRSCYVQDTNDLRPSLLCLSEPLRTPSLYGTGV